MYTVEKTMTFAAAHKLCLPYETKCNGLHGHQWGVTVRVQAEELNECGMVIDFKHIKNVVVNSFDHTFLNESVPETIKKYGLSVPFRYEFIQAPTAEILCYVIAKLVNDQLIAWDNVRRVTYVKVIESEGSEATWTLD